jgi:hypothetical protein
MEVDCSDTTYKSLQSVAVVMFFVYPIGASYVSIYTRITQSRNGFDIQLSVVNLCTLLQVCLLCRRTCSGKITLGCMDCNLHLSFGTELCHRGLRQRHSHGGTETGTLFTSWFGTTAHAGTSGRSSSSSANSLLPVTWPESFLECSNLLISVQSHSNT